MEKVNTKVKRKIVFESLEEVKDQTFKMIEHAMEGFQQSAEAHAKQAKDCYPADYKPNMLESLKVVVMLKNEHGTAMMETGSVDKTCYAHFAKVLQGQAEEHINNDNQVDRDFKEKTLAMLDKTLKRLEARHAGGDESDEEAFIN